MRAPALILAAAFLSACAHDRPATQAKAPEASPSAASPAAAPVSALAEADAVWAKAIGRKLELDLEPMPYAYYAYLKGAPPDYKHIASDVDHAAQFLDESLKYQAKVRALPPGELNQKRRASLEKNLERAAQAVETLRSRAAMLAR